MSSAEEQLHERETSGDSDAAVYVKQRRRRVEKVAQRVSAGKVRQMMTSAAGAAPACPAKQSNRVAPPGARPFLIAYPPLARWANLWSRLTALAPSQIPDELVASTGPYQGTTCITARQRSRFLLRPGRAVACPVAAAPAAASRNSFPQPGLVPGPEYTGQTCSGPGPSLCLWVAWGS